MSKWAANTSEIRDNGFGTSRNGKTIEGAVLHHGAGTNVLDYVANANSRDSHPTYHVSDGGRVTGIVHPDRRPFSTSHSVDSVAVTFEIDNESTGGDWPVSDKALSAVIDVIVDHARQSGYKVIGKNTPGKDQPDLFFVAWHQQYVQTACPGPYVLGKIDWIIREANARLNNHSQASNNVGQEGDDMYLIQIKGKANARRGGLYAVIKGEAKFIGGTAPAGVPVFTDEAQIKALQAVIPGLK
ncbi:N-acetylmuramoyl-L-alanine amidase [Leucobacter sp. cx-42]|uniref:peptidoglycan recognition protein family protein n=1 Tax=unclassified Leucobacter TaxID=2621730 RepID=UPI00165D5930|nr:MULTISPECIES: N-acetylmuramoyl-L-alanine amidase [unclassified Leucobacter]MBC9953227.1 N-acetylmuramoyl-L-alanine amidase [Leucobacter sp. cx-42]